MVISLCLLGIYKEFAISLVFVKYPYPRFNYKETMKMRSMLGEWCAGLTSFIMVITSSLLGIYNSTASTLPWQIYYNWSVCPDTGSIIHKQWSWDLSWVMFGSNRLYYGHNLVSTGIYKRLHISPLGLILNHLKGQSMQCILPKIFSLTLPRQIYLSWQRFKYRWTMKSEFIVSDARV